MLKEKSLDKALDNINSLIFTGAPMFSVSVPTFQFIAEVIYPVSEIQGISLVNVINKLISFGTVKLGTNIGPE